MRNVYAILRYSVGLRASILGYASTSTLEQREFTLLFIDVLPNSLLVETVKYPIMKHLKTCIAVSLDGFIATKDNELDWMPENVKLEISATYEQSDVLLAGVNTYSYIFEHWGGWPYKSKKTFVVSHYDTNVTEKENVTFLTDMPLRAVNELKSSSETDIQVIGGGKFITSLIEASLLDEITLYIVPVMLGDGIKFIGKTFGSKWELTGHRVIDNQVVCLTYQYKGE